MLTKDVKGSTRMKKMNQKAETNNVNNDWLMTIMLTVEEKFGSKKMDFIFNQLIKVKVSCLLINLVKVVTRKVQNNNNKLNNNKSNNRNKSKV